MNCRQRKRPRSSFIWDLTHPVSLRNKKEMGWEWMESQERPCGKNWIVVVFFQTAFKDRPDLEATSLFPWVRKHHVSSCVCHLNLSSASVTVVSHHGQHIYSRSSPWKWLCNINNWMVCRVMGQCCCKMSLLLMRQENVYLSAQIMHCLYFLW